MGIAALEDKIVQQVVVTILNQIYEVDFKGFSYGFRPGRGPHQALDALAVGIQWKLVNWMLDADIRGFPIHLRYGLPGCSPPFDGSNQVSPAPEGFYFQAFGSLVTLPAAGYHYNMDWTPCVGGTCTRWNGS